MKKYVKPEIVALDTTKATKLAAAAANVVLTITKKTEEIK